MDEHHRGRAQRAASKLPPAVPHDAPVTLRPDYPGGGQIISSADDIRAAYSSGRGSLKARARWKIDCWFFRDDLPRPDVKMRDRLLDVSGEERLAILRLKDAAIRAGRWPSRPAE